MADKPKVIILGGVGFIGRNLVKYLVDNNVCSKIRVVDKVLPSTAFFGKIHQEAFDNPLVDYMQGSLTSPKSIETVFTKDMAGQSFDFVFHLAAETKYGQTDAVYEEKIFDVAKKCSEEAIRQRVKKFIYVSTAQVYEGKKAIKKEDGRMGPWTTLAVYSLKAEEALRAMKGLPLIVVRPAVVYGPGDINGISPRIICGAVYKFLGEKMKFLWSSSLRINTVHVFDVVAALWHLAHKVEPGTLWNLADKSDSTQGTINSFLEPIFGIKTGFQGDAVSALAKSQLKSVTETVNDKHLKPWSDLCKQSGIVNTPLTPYLDQELLYKNQLTIDGSAIEATGFAYRYPKVTAELIKEQIDYFVQQNLFPKI